MIKFISVICTQLFDEYMSIKKYDFVDIKTKAEKLRKISRRHYESEPSNVRDKILEKEEFAPIIGTLCDERIKADHAWNIPHFIYVKLGSLNPENLLKRGKTNLRSLLAEYLTNKWPTGMSSKERGGMVR
jgi:hypothetical protein